MELAVDAILIFSAVFCMWAGTRRGFIRSVMGVVNALVSSFAAYAFTPALAPVIEKRILSGRLVGEIESVLRASLDTSTDLFNLDETLSNLPSWFTDLLSRYHVSLDSIADVMRGIVGADETSLHNLSERIAYPTASTLASAAAFAILFAGAFLVMSLLTAVLDLIFRMPVLNGANMFFGFLAGAVEAVVLVSVLSVVMNAGVRALGAFDSSWFGDRVMDNTILCSFLVEHNPLSFLTAVLK